MAGEVKTQKVYGRIKTCETKHKSVLGNPMVTPYVVLIGSKKQEKEDGRFEYGW